MLVVILVLLIMGCNYCAIWLRTLVMVMVVMNDDGCGGRSCDGGDDR